MKRKKSVSVQNYLKKKGSIGQSTYTEPDGAAVPVPCNVYPLDAAEVVEYGVQELETLKLYCDSWPGNLHSRITYRGEEWDQAAPVKGFDNTVKLKNVVVIIKKRG